MLKKLTVLFSILLVLVLAGGILVYNFSDRVILEAGELTTIERQFDQDINRLKLDIDTEVYVAQGIENSLKVEAGKNILDKISIIETSRSLEIIEGKDTLLQLNLGENSDTSIKVTIILKNLQEVEVEGDTLLTLDGLETENLSLEFYGSSKIIGKNLNIQNLDITNQGSGLVELSGTSQTMYLAGSKNSTFKGYNLNVQSADLLTEDNAYAEIQVNSDLTVNLSGSSAVYYRGDVDLQNIDVQNSGLGEIKRF